MPTADDLDPIQDSKRFYESLMTDAEVAAPAALPPIPTERLDETEAFRSANRKAQRLHMAFDLFRSLVSGCWREAIGPGNSTGKIRSWCWDQADAFIGEGDKPTPTPAVTASVASVSAGRRSEDERHTHTAAGWHRVAPSDDDDTVDYTPPNTPPAGDLESQQPAERAA